MDRDTALDLSCESGLSAMLRLDSRESRELSVRRVLKYAELVAAKERETCAELRKALNLPPGYKGVQKDAWERGAEDYEDAIRARGATDGKPT